MKKFFPILLAVSMLLCGCSSPGGEPPSENTPEEYTSYVYAMDTVMTLRAYADTDVNPALANISGAIEALEKKISVTDENSEISKANSSTGPVELSDDTAEIVSRALEICQSTYGILDISVYPVVRSWGFTTGEYKVPNYNDLNAMLKKVDYSKISMNGNTLTLAPGQQIDLGSVAKGYVGDLAADMLKESGVQSAVLDLGGNVRLVGSNTNGQPWKVGIQDPLDASKYFGIISASDKSLVTSGGYNRYFEADGKTYWHIIDPRNGHPADNGVISATIVGDDGLMCDGLSTATFIMGVNDAFDYWRKTGGFDMLLMTKHGHIYITPGLEDSFTLLDEYADDYIVEVVQ